MVRNGLRTGRPRQGGRWCPVLLVAWLAACASQVPPAGQAGPVALVVVTPGLDRSAFRPLAQAFEDKGIETWTAWIPPDASWPADGAALEASTWIRAAARAAGAPGRPTALVGHGPGATLALLAAPGVADAVVALGPILGPPGTRVGEWLAALPVPEGGVDLATPLAWNGHDVASLLLGTHVPPLGPLPAPLARDWQRWITEGPPLDPREVTCPVWVAAGARDRLAPVESIRRPADAFPNATFVRFGLLRFDRHDPGSADLLAERAVRRTAARWLRSTLDGRDG